MGARAVRAVLAGVAPALALGACGGDAGMVVLGEDEAALVQAQLDRLGTELVQAHQDVGVGGMSYSPADGYVTGFVSTDVFSPLEKCQTYADVLGELDGPPATVPVRIIAYIDKGRDHEVLAEGVGGGACHTG